MSEEAVRAYARAKHFGGVTLERWLRQAAPDRDALLEVADRLRLGENQFRDVLDLVEGIAARRHCTLAAVLASDETRRIVAHPRGRNEGIKALKEALRRLRYPQLAAVEETLLRLARGLRLPGGVRVELPENLEGGCLSISMRAGSAAELRAQAAALAAAAEQAEIDEMFRLLAGKW